TLYEAGAMSEIDFRAAQAQLEAAQAQLAGARAQQAGAAEQARRTVVTAPFAGEVSARSVNAGEAVNPGQTLFTVVNSASLELQGQVPVDQAARVREGQPVVFQVEAYPGVEFRGTVARVAPVADPGTRQVRVILRLPNEDGSLIGGLFATGRVITGTDESAIVVPETALRGADGDRHVLVIEDSLMVRRSVTLGERDEERGLVAIAGGLRAGERVVAAPGEVAPGTRVRIDSAAAGDDRVAQEGA